ncbi:MAG: hypothetical protein LBJ72_11680 [Dysgonamonadaceae bacterium]|jgi:hypothetical protein|nr:hypothetical protein [Dysgonamonadaceae bacterium]
MKHKQLFILFSTALFLLIACDELFVGGTKGTDADLQGKWQQIPDKNVYYNFQNGLFEYQEYRTKDSILSAYGYYTLLGDTGIYLELLPIYNQINLWNTAYSMDFLGWDTIPGNTVTDTLVQQFSLRFVTSKKMNLSNHSKNHDFRRF